MSGDEFNLTGGDPAFDRLRAADPAGLARPDLAAIRASVNMRIKATPVDEMAARRGRSGRPWLMGAAAIAAGAVIVGSGGFALGTVASGSASSKVVPTAGIVASPTAPTDMTNGMSLQDLTAAKYAPQYPNSVKGGDLASLTHGGQGWSSGVLQFTASANASVWGTSGVAVAYAYDAASANPIAASNGLLRAVGAKQNTKYNVTLGKYVGGSGGQVLSVQTNGLMSVQYADSNLANANCRSTANGMGGAVQPMYGAVSGTINTLPTSCVPATAANGPSRAPALLASQKVLTAAGLDASSYRWVVGAPTNGVVSVTAVAKVGGQELVNTSAGFDPNWQFRVTTGNKVSHVSGALARIVSLGRYKVVSAAAGAARLNDSTYHAQTSRPQGAPSAVPVAGGSPLSNSTGVATSPPTESAGGASVPSAPIPGSKVAWPVRTITIVKSNLRLAPYAQPNGAVVLMPTYDMTAADGSRYYVIAVDSAALDTSAP